MAQRKNKLIKDKLSQNNSSKSIIYSNKVGIPKGFVMFNSVEQQNLIINKKADKSKPASYYSLTFNYCDCL